MEEEVEALKKNRLKLEILDPTGVVVRTHHFDFEALYGSRLKLTITDNIYMMNRDGGLIENPKPTIDKEWATEFKARHNKDQDNE